jgi:hypothetical protein
MKRSYKTDAQTDRMAKALERRYSLLLVEGHSQLIRLLIQRQWIAEFEPQKLANGASRKKRKTVLKNESGQLFLIPKSMLTGAVQ